jgi:hypothetical protein
MCDRCLNIIRHDFDTLTLLSQGAAANKPPVDVSDWKCTILFYMACLYVRALAHQKGKDIHRHIEARDWINAEKDLIPIARSYRKLEERSRDARYEGRKFTRSEMDEILRWFCDVRETLIHLLAGSGLANVPRVDPQHIL